MRLTGRLDGMTITLDVPVPPLDGKRVRVVVEPVEDSEAMLTAEQQAELFRKWVDDGPQGPIGFSASLDGDRCD
jgi:hypothetical protein